MSARSERGLPAPRISIDKQVPRHLQTGLGRPVNPEWMLGVMGTFRKHAPAGSVFLPNLVPGLRYINGPDWAFRNHYGVYGGKAHEDRAIIDIRSFVRRLRSHNLLQPSAEQSRTLRVVHPVQASSTEYGNGVAWTMRVSDQPAREYRTGFLVEAEKHIIRNRAPGIGPIDTPARQSERVHTVSLGTVLLPPEASLHTTIVDALAHALPPIVEVGGVDIVR